MALPVQFSIKQIVFKRSGNDRLNVFVVLYAHFAHI